MFNIDNHMEEHLAAKAAEIEAARVEAEAEEARRQEMLAKADLERRERWRLADEENRRRLIAEGLTWKVPLAAEIDDLVGHTASVDRETGTLKVDGVDMGWFIRRDASYGRNGKKYALVVGTHNDRSRFPQKKTGGYNYREIALRLIRHAAGELLRTAGTRMKEGNREAVKEVSQALGLPENQYVVTPSSQHEGQVVVSLGNLFTKSLSLSPEKAVEVLEGLRALGLKLTHQG